MSANNTNTKQLLISQSINAINQLIDKLQYI